MSNNNNDYENTIFSPRWFMENMLYIVDKDSKLTKFKLNQEQSAMLEHIEMCLELDLPIRIIVLKARQIGSTTFFTALGFWFAAMNKNIDFGIVAHKDDSARAIFNKCKVFYNNLPTQMKPKFTQMSSEGITFDDKDGKGINSTIHFAAATPDVYRGRTLTYRLESERAFYDRSSIDAIDNSLSQTVSLRKRTIIVKESTANGYNFFKDEWDLAVKGQSSYKPFFFGWQDHKEYTEEPPKDFKLTPEEEKIRERFPNITDGQLYWRRKQILDSYKGNELQFRQENPMTPEEAFIASGGGVFSPETIKQGYETCEEPRKLVLNSSDRFSPLLVFEEPKKELKQNFAKKVEWSDEKQQYIYVDTDLIESEDTYITPYTVGVDTAGLGKDINQVVVIDNITKHLVARFEKKDMSEENIAQVAIEVAKMYNNALIAPEVNYSHEICNHISRLGYNNIYITENIATIGQYTTNSYGWKTTNSSKSQMISFLKSQIDANPSIIKDRGFWYEAEYYLIEDPIKNVMNAASGHHDDIIIATAIAMYVSTSFQSKQTYNIIKGAITEKQQSWLVNQFSKNNNNKNRPKLRRGIYDNKA